MRLKTVFGNNMRLLYTDTDRLKSFIKNTNPDELDDRLKDYVDNIFPSEQGKNEKYFASLKFENGECPCRDHNAKAPKTREEKIINQLRSVKAKRLKREFKYIYMRQRL